MKREGQLNFDRIGQYWDQGETEIDIIFTNDRDREIYFGECKLSAKRFNIEEPIRGHSNNCYKVGCLQGK